MRNFEFHCPTKVFFGQGEIDKLGDAILQYGTNVLLTYGGGSIKNNGIYNTIIEIFNKYEIGFFELSDIKPNPTIHSVREGVEICKENEIDLILAVGGGSIIDCSKAIAAGYYYDGDPWDFYTGKAQIETGLPIGAILTLSATGSEMNGFSVISYEEEGLKLAAGHPDLRPVFSILDPEHTFSVPKNQTAAGTADIISHCLEQYFSAEKDTYLQDRLTEAIIKTCMHNGPIALEEPENYDARANLMWASSLALNGMLSTGKLGDWATHQIEHKLSAIWDLTHGIGLAIITPHWMRNILSEETVHKFVNLGKNLFDIEESDAFEAAEKTISKLYEFFRKMGIPANLKEAGIDVPEDMIEEMADSILQFGPIGQIKKLEKDDVSEILKAIL
jgi:alcohol dehydrogenase YqhD (iron-dependent ADH family)